MIRKTAVPATLAACLDLFLKLWPGLREGTLVPGVLEVRRVTNTGAAFGLLPGAPWALGVLGAAAIALLALYLRGDPPRGFMAAGFALLLGGAAGNLLDRLLHGFVHDWLMFSFVRFPVFNLADAFLTAGAALLAFGLLRPGAEAA